MEHINRAVVDGAHVVASIVQYQIRQAATSSTTLPTTTTQAGASPTGLSSMMTSSATDAAASPTGEPPKDGGGGGGGSSSPLLFFVALGFGVVFTNLWIIVGVKYCFRYNARNRAMARLDENGEPIDLQSMPARPHRRRREKKLMSMDEVNEKFPMVKYKMWMLARKKEGLPTAGGISAPNTRPNSVRSVEGIVPEQTSDLRDSVDEPTANTATQPERETQNQPKPTIKDEKKPSTEPTGTTAPTGTDSAPATTNEVPADAAAQLDTASSKNDRTSHDDDEDDEDDPINAAVDPAMMESSGDTCAICIDTLEDDDDVRGLTCGHAFHAVCLDPWLTNRRACCPLCKADYYTPRARPQPAETEPRDPNAPATATDPSRNNSRLNYPRPPVRSFAWSHFRDAPRQMFSSRFDDTPRDPAETDRQYRAREHHMRASRRATATQAQRTGVPEESEGGALTRFRNRFPPFRLNQMMRRNQDAQAAEPQPSGSNTGTAPASTTPSQLEAGVRPTTETN
ncbi:hypothetical protein F4808DRAFT_457090 [Astrocystis sublimbata]|nr:hypothetical protein F4808DRAFT_457090 [Astrocystis sublimbata]